MAVPPTIPTSFVPHSAASDMRRTPGDFAVAFGFIAYFVCGLSIVAALAVFGYGHLLAAQKTAKDKQLADADAALDPATVTNFVRLRDRLSSGAQLLQNHVAYSGLFTVLEKTLPQTVRLGQVHVAQGAAAAQGVSTIILSANGTAKTFNALAAASDALAADGRIKGAIFSGITVATTGGVNFTLTATVDPALVAFTAPATAATSTDTTTP